MPVDFDNFEIGESRLPDTVDTKLTQLDLWSFVSPLLNHPEFDPAKRKAILQVPVKEHRSINVGGYWDQNKQTIFVNQAICGELLKTTFLHELAHTVNDIMFGPNTDAHGKHWKEIMECFGQKPERCHSFGHILRMSK
jgi:hypothetical protein